MTIRIDTREVHKAAIHVKMQCDDMQDTLVRLRYINKKLKYDFTGNRASRIKGAMEKWILHEQILVEQLHYLSQALEAARKAFDEVDSGL